MSDSLNLRLHSLLREREAAGLIRQRRVVDRREGQRVWLRDPATGEPRERHLLSFASNDTLGLSQHPRVVEAFRRGVDLWGAGSGASHLVSGHTAAHEELEWALADWMAPHIPSPMALEFSTGYLANLGALSGLAGPLSGLGLRIYADRLNHASLVEGALLSGLGRGAKTPPKRYPHGDAAALAEMLEADQCAQPGQRPLIVTDGVFSMDGDLAPLTELLALAEAHDGLLLVDEAHGAGALGPEGRGSLGLAGLRSERLLVVVTLGKAFGVAGASLICSRGIRDVLLQTARPYIYTTASPPAVAVGLLTALALIRGDEGEVLRGRLSAHIQQVQAAGLAGLLRGLLRSETSIQPIVLGTAEHAVEASALLEAAGYWVPAIRPPTVPEGTARLRVSLSADHQADEVSVLIEALSRLG